jgi:hypothetical protein
MLARHNADNFYRQSAATTTNGRASTLRIRVRRGQGRQILVSQRVKAALAGNIAPEQVSALALKGLSQPVIAFNVPVASSANLATVRPEGAPEYIPGDRAR